MANSQRSYTFDVFDTCLVRRYLRPKDLLVELAECALAERRPSKRFGPEEVHELFAGRLAAAKRADAEADGGVATLDAIYQAFVELTDWGIDALQMKRLEIELECRSVRPITATRSRVEQLRATGARILFVSDMYLGEMVVRRMLEEHGFARPQDAIYVSCDHGCTKWGGLFDLVLEREGLSPRRVEHHGDSVVSDVLAAKRSGMRATHYKASLTNRYEQAMLAVSVEQPHIDARIAGLCRATRLTIEPHPVLPPQAATVAADVVAPLLNSYVVWVLRTAQQAGIQRLYFLARDGQVLLKAARAIVAGRPLEKFPELRYLHGSRQAWLLPSVMTGARDELDFALLDGQSNALSHCLRRLRVRPDEIADDLLHHGFPPDSWDRQLDAHAKDRLWTVLEEPGVAALIAKRASACRQLALAYFRQEGLLDDDLWAVVDVGWTLRAQASLRKILVSGGQFHIDAFYLGLSRRRFSAYEYGSARGFLLEEAETDNGDEGGRPMFENKGLIDQIFTMADHGTTQRYLERDGRIVPELAEPDTDERRAAFCRLAHAATVDFAAGLVDSRHLLDHPDELKRAARRTTNLFLSRPRHEDVAAIAWASISDDPNELRQACLARPLSTAAMTRVLVHVGRQARNGPQGQPTSPDGLSKDLGWGFSWLEGSLALSGPKGRLAILVLRRARHHVRHRHHLAATLAGLTRAMPLGSVLRVAGALVARAGAASRETSR